MTSEIAAEREGSTETLATNHAKLIEGDAASTELYPAESAEPFWLAPDAFAGNTVRNSPSPLEAIARRGRDGFYAGKVAKLIAADMKKNGGLVDEQALALADAADEVANGLSNCIDMARCARNRLGKHLALHVVNPGGEVAGLAN